MRLLILLLISLGPLMGVGTAAPVQIIDVPETLVPGQSFVVGVRFPSITSLSIYQVDLTLTANSGIAGTDFSFGNVSVASPTSGYVFPSNQEFFSATNLDSPTTQRLSLSDFDLTGIDTIGGVNDRIATVSIQTLASFTGTLVLAIDSAALILDGPQITPTPVPEFATIQSDTFNQSPNFVSAVPEPSSVVFMASMVGGVATILRRRIDLRACRMPT